MRKMIMGLVLLGGFPAFGQYGYGSRAPAGPSQAEVLNHPSPQTQEAIRRQQQATARASQQYLQANWAPRDPYRLIGTNVWSARGPGWFQLSGTILERRTNGVLVDGTFGVPFQDFPFGGTMHTNKSVFLIRRLPYLFPDGHILPAHNIVARQEDTLNEGSRVIVGFDYGVPYSAAELASKRKAQQDRKSFEALLAAASNGTARVRYDLGLRYLNGVGCETNRELAIEWFTQAAAQGDLDASNRLAALSAP